VSNVAATALNDVTSITPTPYQCPAWRGDEVRADRAQASHERRRQASA